MIYKIQEKFFTLGHNFIIQNSEGQEVYEADGKFLSLGNKLAFHDMAGNELAYILRKPFTFGHTYEIYRDGVLQAIVDESMFTPFQHRFTVDVDGPNDLVAQGSFLDLEFTMTRGDQPIATISRERFNLQHTYTVDVVDGEDHVFVLACAVVIDLARESAHRRR